MCDVYKMLAFCWFFTVGLWCCSNSCCELLAHSKYSSTTRTHSILRTGSPYSHGRYFVFVLERVLVDFITTAFNVRCVHSRWLLPSLIIFFTREKVIIFKSGSVNIHVTFSCLYSRFNLLKSSIRRSNKILFHNNIHKQ